MEITLLQKISFLVLRIMGSLIFITAGLNHLFQTAGATARLENAKLGHFATWIAPAETLIILSGIGLLVGGIFLLLGFKTKIASLLLLFILIPITLTIQVSGEGVSGPLFKNIALMGILLFFILNGASFYGLDQFIKQKIRIQFNGNKKWNKKGVVTLVTGLVLLFGSFTTIISIAQNSETQATKQNYAVLISQPNHLKAAVNTAETIISNSQYNRDIFLVMACGKSVEAFVRESEMAQVFEKGKAAGISFKICGMSLKQFNIDPTTLVDGIEIIPNGLTFMFDLQQQGYMTVEL